MQPGSIEGGFAHPVFDAQAVFRAVMNAFAQPGSLHGLDVSARPPVPLTSVEAAVALTVCDHDTPLWLDAHLRASDAVSAWLGFHTGAPLVGDPADAAFAIVADPANMPPLSRFAAGTQDYPDRSTTLILRVESLETGPPLLMKGPGIATRARIAPCGLPDDFLSQWRQNGTLFPRGVDLVLAASDAIACLPRTTRIEATED